jgi:DNA-binding transcriptional MerR regulator
MKRYRISAFSKRSGIPADTLRYYEKLKLIAPVRQDLNDYRTYDDHDLIMAMQLRMMRSVDVPLSLLHPDENPHTLSAIERHLTAEETNLTAHINALEAKRRRVQVLTSELEECRLSAGKCREVEYPETLNLDLPDEVTDDALAAMIARWQSNQPFIHLYCVLDEEELRAPGAGPMKARLGLGVLASYADRLNLPVDQHVVRKAPSQGVRCVLKVRDPLHPLPEEFLPLTQYLTETGRTTTGSWQYRIRFIDKQADGSQICYIAIRVNLCPL